MFCSPFGGPETVSRGSRKETKKRHPAISSHRVLEQCFTLVFTFPRKLLSCSQVQKVEITVLLYSQVEENVKKNEKFCKALLHFLRIRKQYHSEDHKGITTVTWVRSDSKLTGRINLPSTRQTDFEKARLIAFF